MQEMMYDQQGVILHTPMSSSALLSTPRNPANMILRANAVLMLAQRRRRWANISSALAQCIGFPLFLLDLDICAIFHGAQARNYTHHLSP